MFYVMGENACAAFMSGKGQTIEDAINNWAASNSSEGAINEFKAFLPTVIEGKEIKVNIVTKIEYSISVIE